MLKWVIGFGGVALVLTVIFVTKHDKFYDTEGKGYEIKCIESSSPSIASGTLICTSEHSQNTKGGQYDPNWWHVFFAWPEGITALLLMLTLGAISWQAWETRKAADATARNVEAFISAQKPQLDVRPHGNPIQDLSSSTPRVQMELGNRGLTSASGLISETWIEILPFPFVDFTDDARYYKATEAISVQPGQKPVVLNIPIPLKEGELAELRKLKKFACVRVKLTYRDRFSKNRQWASFGNWVQLDGMGFLEKYNDSGEDQNPN